MKRLTAEPERHETLSYLRRLEPLVWLFCAIAGLLGLSYLQTMEYALRGC